MVKTRRQSHGQISDKLESLSPETSERKRGRKSQDGLTTRKKARLSQSPQSRGEQARATREDAFMSGALPCNDNGPLSGEMTARNSESAYIHETMPSQNVTSGLASVDTHNEGASNSEGSAVLSKISSTFTNGSRKPTHKRFGGEEPYNSPVETVQLNEQTITARADDDYDDTHPSDDDAPEDITAVVAQAQSRQAAAETTKAVEQQRSRSKRRRRERDERLKQQRVISDKDFVTYNVPDLLPDSVLEVEPIRRETPDPDDSRAANRAVMHQARKKLDLEDQLGDVKVGPIQARVLEKINKYLPPKADERGKQLRERWLLGKRDRSSLFDRRKRVGANAGFLRG